MFQPETEDMLPRAAPKPSAEQANAMLQAKPTVPEVSLLFAQQQQQPQQQAPDQKTSNNATTTTTQSYAQWKKHMLPRVNYCDQSPPHFGSSGKDVRFSLYPMRPTLPSSANSIASNTDIQYHRYLDSTQPKYLDAQYFHSSGSGNLPQQQPQRRSLEPTIPIPPPQQQQQAQLAFTPRQCGGQEVLTICAGTQTEPVLFNSDTHDSKVASIEDFQQLLALMHQMREDQLRLTRICEALVQQARPVRKPQCTEVGTQCEILALNNASNQRRAVNLLRDCIIEENERQSPTNAEPPLSTASPPPAAIPLPAHHYNQLKEPVQQYAQSPRLNSRPMAQSTAYRSNTPPPASSQNNANRYQDCQISANVVNVLPKATTEKSMVMNELALKYLPNDKLNELLQELRIVQDSSPPCMECPKQPLTPLRAIDTNGGYGKSPNDMSNASYKYLKKYRLLPEEEQKLNAQENNENLLRRPLSPLCAPRQRQHQQQRQPSPLALRKTDAQMQIDLDNIRNQPKFF